MLITLYLWFGSCIGRVVLHLYYKLYHFLLYAIVLHAGIDLLDYIENANHINCHFLWSILNLGILIGTLLLWS